jgi:hypothetical protein
MKGQRYAATKTTEIRLVRRSPEYWRVTFDHPNRLFRQTDNHGYQAPGQRR